MNLPVFPLFPSPFSSFLCTSFFKTYFLFILPVKVPIKLYYSGLRFKWENSSCLAHCGHLDHDTMCVCCVNHLWRFLPWGTPLSNHHKMCTSPDVAHDVETGLGTSNLFNVDILCLEWKECLVSLATDELTLSDNCVAYGFFLCRHQVSFN